MPTFDLGYPPSQHQSTRPGYDGTSLQCFFDAFPNDDACLDHLFRHRFGHAAQCPRCGGFGGWRRHFIQKHFFHSCGGILSPMHGVIFSRSKIPLQLWFYAMLHFGNSPEGIPAPFLARQLGVSEPTAFRMSKRIRLHMALIDREHLLGGHGEVVSIRLAKVLRIVNTRKNVQNSAMILLLSDARRVNSTVLVRPTQKSMNNIISAKILPDSTLITECFWTFRILKNYSSGKTNVGFFPDYFSKENGNNNQNHGFLQYFNLSFSDQFRGVNLENAWLYLKEYEFRYNRRNQSPNPFEDMIASFPEFDQEALGAAQASHFVNDAPERVKEGGNF